MDNFIPFRGISYNSKKIPCFSEVISPPYDKISPEERKILWERNEYNIIKLIHPPPGGSQTDLMTQSADEESSSWYGQAAERLNAWIQAGVFCIDSPRFYHYQQTFTHENSTYTRPGIFGALRLQEESGVYAHEHTFEGPKADRLRLLRATQTNLSPIFLLGDGSYSDWENVFKWATQPLVEFTDLKGRIHRINAIDSEMDRKTASEFLSARTFVIADGHHRYETALNYKQEKETETGLDPKSQTWGSVLALVVPVECPDLLVLPTHRILSGLPDGWLKKLHDNITPYFDITPIENPCAETVCQHLQEKEQTLAVVAKEKSFCMTLKDSLPSALSDVPLALRKLNVTILHRFILEQCLQISPQSIPNHIRFVRGESEAISMVQKGPSQAAFLLSALSPQTVFKVSLEGQRMPQKSTDFYPKIPTGLLLRSVADENA